MNIFVPQSYQAVAELKSLAHVNQNIVSTQANKPVIGIIQDPLVGSYLLTKGREMIDKEDFFDYAFRAGVSDRIDDLYERAKKFYKFKNREEMYFGKILFSLLFPRDFQYTLKTNTDPNEPEFVVKNGVIVCGRLCKRLLGTSQGGLIHTIYKVYSPDRSAEFISSLQILVNNWLSQCGFSVGLKDCLINDRTDIDSSISKAEVEVEHLFKTEHRSEIRELKINVALNAAKDIGHKLSKDQLDPNNRLKTMIDCGSKGNYVNIAQITSLLGQQNVCGNRIQKDITGGRRTLPCFHSYDDGPDSRGFVRHSYLQGLSPSEYWFHAGGGREGLVDTAILTADSGYLQRKIIKALEDLKIEYDGTVRNAIGTIYQFAYGDDGFAGEKLIVKDGQTLFCDPKKLADLLNAEDSDDDIEEEDVE